MRAQQLRGEPRWRMVWVACGISWAFGAATAPYVWRGLEWAGHRIGVPNIIWELGFGLWWALPAAVFSVLFLYANVAAHRVLDFIGHEDEEVWKSQLRDCVHEHISIP